MKRLNVISGIVFAASAVIFAGYQYREIRGADRLGPQIQIDGERIEVSVKVKEQELLEGVTAIDAKDGDVTDSVVVENISSFLDKGRRLVSYVAFDSDNHVTKASRQIVYTDYEEPKFQLSAPLVFVAGEENLLANIRAVDCIDGDISNKIKITSDSAFYLAEGEYKVNFEISNSCGDVVSLPATVEICNRADELYRPHIELSNYLIYVKKGEKIDPQAYLKRVVIGEQEYALTDANESYGNDDDTGYATIQRSRVEIKNNVDYKEPGTYEVVYSMTGLDGTKGRTRLIVVVTDDASGDEAQEEL